MSDLPVRFRIGSVDGTQDPQVFVPIDGGLALVAASDSLRLPRRSELAPDIAVLPLGTLDDEAFVVGLLSPEAVQAHGLAIRGLRTLFGWLDGDRFAIAGLATQLAHFEAMSRHCSQCGRPVETREVPGARFGAKACTACAREIYPQVAPCAIVLVSRGDEVLLTRKTMFPPGVYGLVAGFLEPAETLEACAQREVLEETGVVCGDLRYFGSQPWPFPSQVMVAFTATWISGDVVVDKTELEDARFFHKDALPALPPLQVSIARRMIDAWVESRR